MKFVLQRVREARVRVDQRVVGEIGHGLLILACIEKGDKEERLVHWARRIPMLRIFNDEEGKMNLSLREVGGSVLVVSQFTLTANLHEKGRRPSFTGAAPPDVARTMIDHFVNLIRSEGIPVAAGEFGAYMQVELINDGPVTFIIDDPPATKTKD